MSTTTQVLRELGGGRDSQAYQAAAARLGIPAGQAYLTATGRPADGSEAAPSERPGSVVGSTQSLVYGHLEVVNPTRKDTVDQWVKQRARVDRQMQAAAAAQASGDEEGKGQGS